MKTPNQTPESTGTSLALAMIPVLTRWAADHGGLRSVRLSRASNAHLNATANDGTWDSWDMSLVAKGEWEATRAQVPRSVSLSDKDAVAEWTRINRAIEKAMKDTIKAAGIQVK